MGRNGGKTYLKNMHIILEEEERGEEGGKKGGEGEREEPTHTLR